jgi:hypothetical protein
MAWYEKGHWGDPKFIKGYECPDDLGGDEVCPLGIYEDEKTMKEGIRMSVKDFWNEEAGVEKKVFAGDLPDGKYVATVLKCEFGKTKDGTKDKTHWDLQVTEGPHARSHIWVDRGFSKTDESEENKKAIQRMLDDFKQLDLPCGTATIAASMDSIIGKTVLIELKMGNTSQFKNFRGYPATGGPVMPPVSESPF